MLTGPPVGQASPDKDVICRYTTAVFTVSPKPGALSCCADLPGDLALYAISVRRLIALHSSFLRTIPREIALAFG
jgi:hypothetical protein